MTSLRTVACSLSTLVISLCVFTSCGDPSSQEIKEGDKLEDFIPVYNDYIEEWLAEQVASTKKGIEETKEEIAKAEAEGKPTESLQDDLTGLKKNYGRFKFRQTFDGYFSFKDESEIPTDLVWDDGMKEPIIGDPKAKKGGTLNMPMVTFPPTLRRFGPKANHGYRGYFYEDTEIGLVGMHPITNQFIPGVAKRWAKSADGRTMYYEIDPDARFSNDVPVHAIDFMWGIYVRVADNVTDPFYSQYFREQIANITVYNDRLLSVSLPEPKPLMPLYAAVIPACGEFYDEYGPDYEERYNWRFEPTTGPYLIRQQDLKKGRSVMLTRNQNWWAKDKKHYANMFNVDRINFTLVQNDSKAFEMFRAGKLDYYPLTLPDYWYSKSEIPPVFDGYIERYTFYNQYPRVPRGLYINVSKPMLENRDLRVGLCYATNWQRVIDAIFQGDYSRLNNFSEGFGPYTNPDVKARPYSISKARESFAKAGFTKKGPDGVLVNDRGQRLSIPITCDSNPIVVGMIAILKEEAKKAGLEYRIDGKERTSVFQYTSEKKHSITFTGWGVTPPFPRYFQFFHSRNAYTDEGAPKPDTNNINCYSDPEMDRIAMAIQTATNVETIKKASWEGQQMIHDEAIFIPGYVTDYVRLGCWRWIRWPDTELMPFCSPVIYDPYDSHLFWIDEDIRKETVDAMSEGKTFPEVQRTISAFRDWEAPLTVEVSAPEEEEYIDDEETASEASLIPELPQPVIQEIERVEAIPAPEPTDSNSDE